MSTGISDYGRMNDSSREARKIRSKYSAELKYGNIPFHQFVLLSKEKHLETLGKMRVLDLLSSFPGWGVLTAQNAFSSNSLPMKMRVKDCQNNEDYLEIISALMNSSASRWQQRVKAPEGWPWFGNVIDTLTEMEDKDLPREIIKCRYHLSGSENVTEDPSRDTSEQETPSTLPPDPMDASDPLDDIFGDDEDEEPTDSLDDIFGDDEGSDEDEEFDIDNYLQE